MRFYSVANIKYNLYRLIIVAILLALIIVRLFLPEGSYAWINVINYIGLLISIVSLFFCMCDKYGQEKKFYPIVSIFVIFLLILICIGVLILTNIIVPSAKANDFIMLLTLLISLPSQLYVDLMGAYLKS